MGRRLSTGGGAHNRLKPPELGAGAWRRPAWLGCCLLLGLPYPWVALLNPPWTYLLLGAPLLLAAWATNPVPPAIRLLGFVVFAAGAVGASLLAGVA